MTLHDVTRMNDEAHGHAQVHGHPLAYKTTRIISARSTRKPGYHNEEPKEKIGKNDDKGGPARLMTVTSIASG